MKTTCDTCERKKQCNTMDRSRGMACNDYEEVKENESFGIVRREEKHR
jgi:hypothetical protein